jgi:GTP-binding protein HflX
MSVARRVVLVTYPNLFTIQEATELAEAANYQVEALVTQRFLRSPKYGLGPGKADEVAQMVRELNLEAVIVDEALKASQTYNLARLCQVEVIDREKLILEIFNRRATTAEAKLQVRLAELRYELPKAREKVRLAKMGEQPGFRGLGRYDADVYYTMIRRQFAEIKRKLEQVSSRRALHRKSRERSQLPVISLAGYTGAGKTTLFNRLTGEGLPVGRGSFTTLATSTRAIKIDGFKALLSDTVGFISRLPTYMIEAFKATLEELAFAHMVLLTVDASEPLHQMAKKYNSCIQVLSELAIPLQKVVVLLNKADLLPQETIQKQAKAVMTDAMPQIIISAKTGYGIERLQRAIYEHVFKVEEERFTLERAAIPLISEELEWAKSFAEVRVEPGDGRLSTSVRGPKWVVRRLRGVLGDAARILAGKA